MMIHQQLHEILEAGKSLNGMDFFTKKVPIHVSDNIKDSYRLRDYQLEAFGRLFYYLEEYPNKPKSSPTQLLFHMATGSGKTIIMAGAILHLFSMGYRNFLFFVNSSNIIRKTKENFLNKNSIKYLFDDDINISGLNLSIQEVNDFNESNENSINIVFSTIQGLHSLLNNPRENSVTYEDLEEKRIAIISDEAHHINSETKKGNELNKEELENIVSWEHTVWKIFNSHKDNILLEFTATADLTNPEILNKYKDRVIFDYPLKQFRVDGYSKEVKTMQADLEPFDRALQAMVLSQFRRKILEEYNISPNPTKPVILFKSRTINDSEIFYEEFNRKLHDLTSASISKIRNLAESDSPISKAFHFFDQHGISNQNLVSELKIEFDESKCLSINSKSESIENQIAVNELEKKDNEYRAIFAVDKLNEGWDVLNLFDIVRLYNTRDAKSGKPGRTTMSEAQLIGRGARYCPFQIESNQPKHQRKYDIRDEQEESVFKICEELYYHCAYNPRYIEELHTALDEIGIKSKETKKRQLRIKESFKNTPVYKSEFIFLNEQIVNKREDVFGLSTSLINTEYNVKLLTGKTYSTNIFEDQDSGGIKYSTITIKLCDIDYAVINKGISQNRFFEFSNLKTYFPHLKTIREFITSNNYLADIIVIIRGTYNNLHPLSQNDKLKVVSEILNKIASHESSTIIKRKGSKVFKPYLLKDKIKDKVLNFSIEGGEDKEFGIGQGETDNDLLNLDLSKTDWYVQNENYGTSEEKFFVKYFNSKIDELKTKYDTVYLLRNERFIKIWNFDDEKAFEPDFILFLKEKQSSKSLHYQLFIEPKGAHLIQFDSWKEKLLLSLNDEVNIEQLWEDKRYILWGLRFYNETLTKRVFNEEFEDFMKLKWD